MWANIRVIGGNFLGLLQMAGCSFTVLVNWRERGDVSKKCLMVKTDFNFFFHNFQTT